MFLFLMFLGVCVFAFCCKDVVLSAYAFVAFFIFVFFVTQFLPRLNALGA